LKVIFHPKAKLFVCECTYEERFTPKKAGFRWIGGKWSTPSHAIASRLRDYLDEPAKIEINRVVLENTPWTGAIPFPKHLTPKDFQIEIGTPWILSRNRSYLGADPGMGKTIMAALAMNALKLPSVYLCPPFLTLDVETKISTWQEGLKSHMPQIFPDSKISRDDVIREIRELARHYSKVNLPPVLFVDEAHRYKNESAERTKILFQEIVPYFQRVVFMSGTPAPNGRPIELFPVLSNCAPETIDFMSKFEFGIKYCKAYRGEWGWDFNGASNVEELMKKVKASFLLRLSAEEYLPPLTEEMVLVQDDMPPRLSNMDRDILKKYDIKDLPGVRIADEHISTYRRECGIAKVDWSVEFIKSILTETQEALVVVAHHKTVIAALEDKLKAFHPIVIDGSVPAKKRYDLVQKFQNEEKHRVIIVNDQAGGVGFDMTKARRVILVEFSWVPDENKQVIHRTRRFGQKGKNILAQYLVFRNSVDSRVMTSNLQKRENQKHV